ncbi:class I SAM-dependent methyltransferase [Nonomuraea basaltis]|uniref:class I SAM-dependent methyltransferase n=1 Tax=Nonomuraea basaltis TaxID=2495887 RepID=UPI00110C55D0|nr:class I SAM-dependent methyltransferase [Nonomuraea basaltis]TMR95776.1 methyltransferase domain-containing protein [Nonomuraea basaltis]
MSGLHKAFFGLMSLAGRRAHGLLLRCYFDIWHLVPDPWNHATSTYERQKYTTTLACVPEGDHMRILDVGCSEGTFTLLASAAHPDAETVGVDISRRAIRRAARRARESGARAAFIRKDVLNEPFDRFDLVFCGEVLYYFGRTGRRRDAVLRLVSLVEPGGLLVLTHAADQAQRLHPDFDGHPMLKKVDEVRAEGYTVSVYRHANPDGSLDRRI